MPKKSAGLLVYHIEQEITKVLLVHPGGPFFVKKDIGSWSIPKGEFEDTEDALAAAKREFTEELGIAIEGIFHPLTPIKQKSGKMVYAWAIDGAPDISAFKSNTFTIQWPPGSEKLQEFPEIDKAEWFSVDAAKEKINSAQVSFLEELALLIK